MMTRPGHAGAGELCKFRSIQCNNEVYSDVVPGIG